MKLSYFPPSNDPDTNLYLENAIADIKEDQDRRISKLDELLVKYIENTKKQEARIKKLEKQVKELKDETKNI